MAFSACDPAQPPAGPARQACLGSLRARIARIEQRPLAACLQSPSKAPAGADRKGTGVLALGIRSADEALGGGFPRAGLTEIHGSQTQGIGAATGFVLALAALLGASPRRPLLWIGTPLSFREGGRPYGPGLAAAGLDANAFLCVETPRLPDSVWAAEEAARSGLPALAVLEARGNPPLLELEGTRRLHWRARDAGMPFVLLRQAGRADTTAAPLRLRIAAGRSAPVPDLTHLAKLVGPPVFELSIEKTPSARPQQILVQWNAHDRRFETPGADPRPVLLPSVHRQDPADGARPLVALRRLG